MYKIIALLMIIMMLGTAYAFTTDDLIAYWDFEEDSGTQLYDLHSGDYNMVTSGVTHGVSCKVGDCYTFGDGDHALTNYVADLNSDKWTFNSWVRRDYSGTYNPIIMSLGNTSESKEYYARVHDSSPKNFEGFAEGNEVDSGVEPINNTWYMVTISYDGTDFNFYVNGAYEGTQTTAPVVSSITRMIFGTRLENDTYHWRGEIDEASLWNRPLTITEIGTLYNSGNGDDYNSIPLPVGLDANYDYSIDITNGQIDLNDVSEPAGGAAQDDWNWIIDGSIVSTDQNYHNVTITQSTDYNICIVAADISEGLEDSLCRTIEIPQWAFSKLSVYTDKANNRITMYSDANTQGPALTDYNWYDASTQTWNGATQDYNWDSATQNTDYNICHYVKSSGNGAEDTNCLMHPTGDWTAPGVSLTTVTPRGNGITELRFACTDNNSGCDTLRYQIQDTNYYYDWTSGTPYDVNWTGTGQFTVTYDSNDLGFLDGSNLSTQDSNTFTTYGAIQFNFYDENSETYEVLNGVTVASNITVDGATTRTLTGTHRLDLNLQDFSASNTAVTFTISLANYGTRYYQLDMNRYTDQNINFLMLPTAEGQSHPMQFYDADGLVTWGTAYAEIRDINFMYYSAGRMKTNASGKIESPNMFFDLDYNYYTYRVTQTGDTNNYDFNAVQITINRPESEQTGLDIDGNWHVEFLNLTPLTDENIQTDTTTKFMLSNTQNGYGLKISTGASLAAATNGRVYTIQIRGNTCGPITGCETTNTVQAYLSTETLTNATIKVRPEYDGPGYAGAVVRTYKLIGPSYELIGIDQTNSDGEINILLVAGDDYYFTVDYDNDGDTDTLLNQQDDGYTKNSITTSSTTIDLIVRTGWTPIEWVRIGFFPQFYKTFTDKNLCVGWEVPDGTTITITRYDDNNLQTITETFTVRDNYCIQSTETAVDSNYTLIFNINGTATFRQTWEIITQVDMNTPTTPTTAAETTTFAFMLTILIIFGAIVAGIIMPGRGLFALSLITIVIFFFALSIGLGEYFLWAGVSGTMILLSDPLKRWISR